MTKWQGGIKKKIDEWFYGRKERRKDEETKSHHAFSAFENG